MGIAASQAIGVTPTSMNLGPIVTNQTGSNEYIFLRNTGTETVTFSATPTITGANASDFNMTPYNCHISSGSTLAPGASCYIFVGFSPSTAAAESATLTFSDSAGPQTVALSGTGVSSKPSITLSDYLLSYNTQVVGTTSSGQYVYLYNNATTPLNLGNVTISGSFLVPNGYNSCNGQTIAAESNCSVYVEFAPTAAGYQTGSLTFNNSGGTALNGVPTVPLAGFATAQTYTSIITPTSLNFTSQQVIGTTTSNQPIKLYNTGNTSLTVGSLAGTDLGLAGATAEFSLYAANGGGDNCSGQPVPPGSSCTIYVTFTPNASGARSGTVSFPVTYSNGTTAALTANLSGTGVAEKDSAVLTPPNVSFVDQTVGVVSNYSIPVYLNNSGNQPFTVGTLTSGGSNPGDFTKTGDTCSGNSVSVSNACQVTFTFTPSAAGMRSATLSFPVNFKDGTTTTLTLTLTGKGITGAKVLQITPGGLQFPAEIQTLTSVAQSITVSNVSNLAVTIGTDTISGTNASEFALTSDNCAGTTLAANSGSCTITVTFTPSAGATGGQTATLNIADNGGGHAASLSGTAITAPQQIAVSQTTLAFGNQPAGSSSSTQVVYFTNQADTAVTISDTLTGSGDFTIVNDNCNNQGQIAARRSCYISANFVPPSTATNGAVTATITETDSASPGTHTINLTGTVVTAGAAVAVSPSSLAFPTQSVGTTSAAQNVGITNTGTANLTITAVASTNTTEFPIASDGCSGATLTPGQQCVFAVKFSPSYGGSRSVSITVTDNASGSPQALAITGTGYGVPLTSFNPTSLTFANTNIGVTATTQTITLKNTGTDTLVISNLSLTGVNSGDYALASNTCGATLAHGASCAITVSFTPTAAGTRSASVSVTDNANNLPSSIQTVAFTGTGVAVPTASANPTTLTFSGTDIGITSAAKLITVTNSGTGPLTIASISIGSTNSGDFAETNTCGATLVAPPTSTCTISVTFTPLAAGSRTAILAITDNAGNTAGATQTVSLSGTGIGLPAAALNTPALTFTNQNVNSTSAAQTVTLSNSGTGPLTITSVAFSGGNSGDFGTSNNCAGSVAVGSNCTISVTFTPTAVGTRSSTLIVTDNAANVTGSTQSVTVSGVGVGVPAATPSPTSVTFSSTSVGSTASPATVTLSNGGTGVLSISSIGISGTNAADFAATNNCAGSVAIGGNCMISITFTPTAAGARGATLTITDNAGNTASSQTVALSGTGSGIPAAAVSPATLTFSTQNVGTSSVAQTVTLSNSGSTALTIASIAISSGTNPGDFSATNNCGTSLTLGSSCSIAVTFSPTAGGARSAVLTVTDNAGNTAGSTQTVALSGAASAIPGATLTPTSLPFGNQNLSTSSTAQTVTLNNAGSAALNITGITVTGANPSDFSATNNCGSSLAFGASCSIAVTFSPTATGSRGATLTVTDNAGNTAGSTQTVALTGNGVGVAASALNPTTLVFGNQNVGVAGAALTITLSNAGSAALNISGVAISGTNGADFAATNNCAGSVAAASSCLISVTFTPGAAGNRGALLTVTDNAGNIAGSTQSVALTGIGVGVPIAVASPNTLTFAPTAIGVTANSQPVTLTNSGSGALTITSVVIGGSNPGDFAQTNNCGASLAVSSSCTINVTFSPAATGARSANLHIVDNAGNTGATQSVALSGTGAAATGSYAKYAETDTITQGTWTSSYGADGQVIANALNSPPPYATVAFTADSTYTWSNSTSDLRDLQTASGATTRIASAYYTYSSFNINVNLTDGNAHRIALYLLDWDGSARAETVSILDATTNVVLDTENFSSFHNGQYAVWTVKGHITIQVTKTGGSNAVVSGLFFDPVPSSASAAYVTTDTVTRGAWTNVYGSNGEVIADDVTNLPSFATLSFNGDLTYLWANPTSNLGALQISNGSSNRIASTFFSNSSFTIDLNLTDGQTHKISLYLLDWLGLTRTETISITDANSGKALANQPFSSFTKGEYAVFNIQGHVFIQVTNTGSPNAVVSGIFFD